MGHFLDFDPFFKTDDLEIKWAVHAKGYAKPGLIAKKTVKTITVLIRGKFVVRFPEINKKVVLSKMGDYLAYDASEVSHISESPEDSVVIVVRWPSKR